jgi:hypothetical protein
MPIKKNKTLHSLKGEVWRDIIDFEGYYRVSNKGRVLGLERKILRIDGTFFTVKKHLFNLKCRDTRGHLMFGVSRGCKCTQKRVHREVAKLFVPNPFNLPDVKNINGDKLDNRSENLKWFDSREVIVGKQKEIEKEKRKNKRDEYKISMLNKIKDLASQRGGECLSNKISALIIN